LAEPEIRRYRPEDAEPSAPLFRALIPGVVHTVPAIRHWMESQPARAGMQAWTAVSDGEVVGWANARLRWSIEANDVAGGWVGVLPEHRRAGLGSRLYELAEKHARSLAARRFTSFAMEASEEGRAFARRRGFEEALRDQYWELDVASAVLRNAPAPAGAELVRLCEVMDRERELFELYDAAHSDMPGDERWTLDFDEWLPEALGDPTLDLDVSAVVLVERRPAAFAWVNTDRENGDGENEMTGTHPGFRRRGLARLAKEQTIRWAADAGLHTLFTANETTNVHMLRLNEHLGYRPTHVQIELVKELRRTRGPGST
jgi:GNAT superfamily N-acetyltransferase